MSVPRVALVGRPNVGKSSLFNRIVGRRRAVVEPTPGVTRDPLQAPVEWTGRTFTVIDTGGLIAPEGDPFAPLITDFAERALQEADAAVLVVDGQAGPLPGDAEVAGRLRRWGRPVVLAVNKSESYKVNPYDFYSLGLGDPLPVSAIHGDGVGDLLDAVLAALAASGAPAPAALAEPAAGKVPQPAEPGETAPDAVAAEHSDSRRRRRRRRALPFPEPALAAPDAAVPIRVALVGRPNAGKSSLVNRLIGAERLMVSDLPGTTRDAVDVPWESDGQRFLLVDTPGMRKKARIRVALERSSVARALRALARAEVGVLVVDAQAGITEQDQRIAGYAFEKGRAAVVLVSKWDLARAGAAEGGPKAAEDRAKEMLGRVRAGLPFLHYAPVLFTSARTGHGIQRIPTVIGRVAAAHRQRLATALVNRVLREAVALHPAPAYGGKPFRLYYATQVAIAPPTLLCFVNDAEAVRPDYAHYLENRIRAAFPLEGTPLRLHFRTRWREPRLGAGAAHRSGRRT